MLSTGILNKYGYGAIFLGILLEDFGVPLPGETLMIAGSVLAAKHEYNILWVMSLAIAGAFIGDNIGYAIGYFGGRSLVLRYGKFLFLNNKRLLSLENFFKRYGNMIVIFARFFEGLRQFNGIVAGTAGMEWKRFLTFNLAGAVLWVGFWCSLAYFLGQNLDITWWSHFKGHTALIGLGLAALLSAFLLIGRYGNKGKAGRR